jgi:cytochrome c-type biogenesis protein CcmF
MDKIQYVGEALWIGHLCKAFIFGSFIAALLSFTSYAISTYRRGSSDHDSWKSIGKTAFWIHGLAIISLLATMFYAMVTHHYEYSYVFDHVSGELPMKYILSAFWEGQEGSFLLWMFWHVVIGFILIRNNDNWHAPVLAIVALAEVWLNSMILGIHLNLFDEIYKIGSNPMTLLRDMNPAPIFSNADYLSLIKGRGLNPLLQNYWMTIHPPTVFCSFALSVVPFAYAIAALWTNTYEEWLKPVFRWALMSAAILGIALIMGSIWAYEALSFGGYWAWDPVENTSLVPWIILVGGIHSNLIARATGQGLKSTFLFYIFGFLLIVYSTLLTRSGILGDTSAHAFTEMGLEWQLTFFNGTFLLIGLVLFFVRYKKITSPAKEESAVSREFWMYVGSLVLMFSGLLINGSSSLPVYNKIRRYFDPAFIGNVLKDPIDHYNKYQLWIAIFIGLLSGIAVWLQYRSEAIKKNILLKKFVIFTLLSCGLTVALCYWINLPFYQHKIMAFASWFAIVSNAAYLIDQLKVNTKGIAAAVSHFGFGLMSIGILASGLNFTNLSNPFMFKGLFGGEGEEEKYIQLIKGSPLMVKNYIVNYEKDTLIGKSRLYDITFKEVNKNQEVVDSFMTRPNAVYANDFSKIAAFNPDTRHYFTKDIFTCVVSLPPAIADSEDAKRIEDSTKYVAYDVALGDTIFLKSKDKLVIDKIQFRPSHSEYLKNKHDVGYGFEYTLYDEFHQINKGEAAIGLDGNILYKYPGVLEKLGIKIRPDESFIDRLLTPEENLTYQNFSVKQNQEVLFKNYKISLTGFDKNTDTTRYQKMDGDISVAGIVKITDGQNTYEAKPIFVIRDSAPMGIKDYIPELGIHIRLANINPKTNVFEIRLAQDARGAMVKIPLEVATGVQRTDYLILEAKIFPGINLYWLGSILMMVGLVLAWFFKKSVK